MTRPGHSTRRPRPPSWRWRTVLIPLLGALATVAACASSAYADTIVPIGIGDLIPVPKRPPGPGTLYETYSGSRLILDVQLGWDEFGDQMGRVIPDVCMSMIVVIGSATVSIIAWIFQVTTLPQLGPHIENAIGGAAGMLLPTLLPVGLAAGGVVAFSRRSQAAGSEIGQLGWVAAAALASVSLLTSPHVWVQGIDDTRNFGADVAMASASAGVPDAPTIPIDIGPATYTGDPRVDMPRKAGDAVWRAFVVTPWCIAEFGSLEACKRYGKGLLDQGTDRGDREDWLKKNVTDQDVGKESVNWRQGHMPQGRLAVTVLSLVAIALFGLMTIVLAFTSIASLIGALMLLVAGTVFACAWMVPGRPRQWGVRWFDALFGMVIQSFIVTMVLGCVLTINAAAVAAMPSLGWLPSIGISICAIVMALRFRKILETILGVGGAGSGMMGGYLLSRAVNAATSQTSRSLGAFRPRRRSQPQRHGKGPDENGSDGDEQPPRRPSPVFGPGGFRGAMGRTGTGLSRGASFTASTLAIPFKRPGPPRVPAPAPRAGDSTSGSGGTPVPPPAAPRSTHHTPKGPSRPGAAATVPAPRPSAALRPERGTVPTPTAFRGVPAAGSRPRPVGSSASRASVRRTATRPLRPGRPRRSGSTT
jgi:hypothetical protein